MTDRPDARRATTLPATLRLGAAHLVVTDLERSLEFYRGPLGLRLHWRDGGRAGLGAGREDLIVLHEEPEARPAGRHAGLYHVALLYPSHDELAQALLRLISTRTPILGASDHGTHDAIYLPDPDGIELELAADNPRQQWPDLATAYSPGPRPLDLGALVASVAEPRPRVDPDLVLGHVHLHVGDVGEGLAFYRDALGFEEQIRLPTAAFVSVDGYHHHLAFNVWRGPGVPAAPADAVGLRHWTIVLDDQKQVHEAAARVRAAGYPVEPRDDGILIRDPWKIAVLLTTADRQLARPLAPRPRRFTK